MLHNLQEQTVMEHMLSLFTLQVYLVRPVSQP